MKIALLVGIFVSTVFLERVRKRTAVSGK